MIQEKYKIKYLDNTKKEEIVFVHYGKQYKTYKFVKIKNDNYNGCDVEKI